LRDARLWDGVYLDIHIYPEREFAEPKQDFLYLRGGKVLLEKDNFGSHLLAGLQELYDSGPKLLRPDEIEALVVWHRQALVRIKGGDIQGNLRRAELIPALLVHFFKTRGEWYEGSKAAFEWLKKHRPDLYAAFETALQPATPFTAIENLVMMVNATIAQEAKPAK
jgi:hypothetical protein